MHRSTVAELRKLFDESIPAAAIAEPLASFDEDCNRNALVDFMQSSSFDLVGVNVKGMTTAYVKLTDLHAAGTIRDCVLTVGNEESVSERESLLSALRVVKANGHAFVISFGQASGIVTLADLSKPPVRMWLFNLVGLLEMHLLIRVRRDFPNDSWRSFIGSAQLSRAKGRLSKKQHKNQQLDLIDCLEFSDVSRIALQTASLVQELSAQVPDPKDFFYRVRQLRNDLAHGHEILADDWPSTIELAGHIEAILTALERSDAAAQPMNQA